LREAEEIDFEKICRPIAPISMIPVFNGFGCRQCPLFYSIARQTVAKHQNVIHGGCSEATIKLPVQKVGRFSSASKAFPVVIPENIDVPDQKDEEIIKNLTSSIRSESGPSPSSNQENLVDMVYPLDEIFPLETISDQRLSEMRKP
jgi:hypothetical protein